MDLVATDPPFKKNYDQRGRPRSASANASFQDRWSWEEDVNGKWVDEIKDENPELMEAIESARHAHSDGMGAFVCFLSVRLMSMRRILKNTGSIFVHCDHSAGHYIKAAMDSIFGRKNFINEIVWCYNTSGQSKTTLSKKHDTIFWYSKSSKYTYNSVRIPFSKEVLKRYYVHRDENGRLYRTSRVGNRVYRYYADQGQNANDWWCDIHALQHNAREHTGYPTQKPIALMKRIVEAASNPGEVVLDPFIGSGTTAKACEELEETRQWIGMDLWEEEQKAIDERVRRIESYIRGSGKVLVTSTPEKRTDSGETACPRLPNQYLREEPPGPRLSRAEIMEMKIREAGGSFCAGCDREFPHPSYLELDHNVPRADGGINHHSNRILLCSPCNKRKSHLHTLSWLRRENRKKGFMVSQEMDGKAINPKADKPIT